jgi:glycosyltransferase involved in cell wall biosynthesis
VPQSAAGARLSFFVVTESGAGVRVAISTGVLRIPPTYFVAQHAELLADRAQFAFFARSASVVQPLPGPLHVPPGTSPPSRVRMILALVAAPWMAASIIRFRPDVVHQHFSTWAGPALWASRVLRVPLFVTLHGYDVLPGRPRGVVQRVASAWHRRGLRQLVRHGAQFLAVSDFLRNEALLAGIPADRVRTFRLGVDAETFSPGHRDAADAQAGGKVVFVGRLSRLKGGDDLIRAMSKVSRPAHLEIVGDGPQRGAWQELARSLGVLATFTGRLPQSAVREILPGAALLVMPSRNDAGRREAAGLTLLEAQACAVPVIAYASGGMPEMLVDGSTGRLVPEGDVPGLARCIDEILGLDVREYQQLSTAARSHIELSADSRSSASALFALFEEALRPQSAPV